MLATDLTLPLPHLPPRARIWVAYSGGLDSTVLLHLLRARNTPNLRAVHVHHGLQSAADDWARQARRFCRQLGVPLSVKKVDVRAARGEGPEAAARTARYAALQSVLREHDLLATAHHRDDQAETVLLRALRGTGVTGLAAMAPLQPLPPGQLWRPLLDIPRARLRAYAEQHQLRWIDDPHNSDPRYARSYLRNELMPRLQRHWPQAQRSLVQLAEQAREAAGLLAELGVADLETARGGEGWSVQALLALPAARRGNALYQLWIAQNWQAPGAAQLAMLERSVLRARADAEPVLRHAQGEWRRYRDRLYALPPLPPLPARPFARRWDGCGRLILPPGCGELQAGPGPAQAGLRVELTGGGERFRPQGSAHSRTLKNLFQEAGVPVWLRRRTPLLRRKGEIVWIGGLGWSAELPTAQRLRGLRWRRPE